MKAPYEPIATVSLGFLILKTVFLVALATGRRRSEIHAFSYDRNLTGFSRNKSSVAILTAKITKPALVDFTSKDIPDYKLCPVHALNMYMERTKEPSIRKGRNRLFLPLKTSHTDTIPPQISSWIVAVVKRAYENCTSDDQILARVNAHEVRALSASWASFNQVPMHEVMQAAFWRGDTSFTNF